MDLNGMRNFSSLFLFARRECDVKMYEMKKLYREVEALNSDGNKLVVGAFQMDGW
jgi:hypothetical protein